MSKRKFLSKVLATTVAFGLASSSAFAETYSLEYLQKIAKQDVPRVAQPGDLTPDHWMYETLKTISEKYGLILGSPGEKFDADQALTRKEAAVMLVSLVGKIQQDSYNLTDVEKDRIGLMKRELNPEMKALTGRVARLEGSVAQLQANDKKQWIFGYGENFRIKGALQFKYDGSFDHDNETLGSTGFSIPTSELGFVGNVHKNIKFVANWKPNRYYNGSTQTMMGDVYASTNYFKNHEIYLGQTRVPIGQESTTSGLRLETINYSQIARNFGGRRDIGVKVAGRYKHFDYFAGAYNGNANYTGSDENGNMDVATWVNFKPFSSEKHGKLVFGGGYAFGRSSVSSTADPTAFDTFGWHAMYNYQKATLKYEGASYWGYKAANKRAGGWTVTGLYDLTDKIQLVSKYDYFDPDNATNENVVSEITGGINYFMHGKNIKFQLNYLLANKHQGSNGQKIIGLTQYAF